MNHMIGRHFGVMCLTVSIRHVGRGLCPAALAVGPSLTARCFGDAAAGRASGRGSDLGTTTLCSRGLNRQLLFIFLPLSLHLVFLFVLLRDTDGCEDKFSH